MKSGITDAPDADASSRMRGFRRDEAGATAVEYGLLVAGLAIALLTAVTAVGANIGGVMNNVSAALK